MLSRQALWADSLLPAQERDEVFDGFLSFPSSRIAAKAFSRKQRLRVLFLMSVYRWVEVYFAWRPNLRAKGLLIRTSPYSPHHIASDTTFLPG